ncbi:MAG: SpoIIE family protein phosphatase [bacterium]|nr:SpoIIE family protein phosphatase [bacterium]MCP4800164.1 SpoIIE family protein phosphatase [bacterium]
MNSEYELHVERAIGPGKSKCGDYCDSIICDNDSVVAICVCDGIGSHSHDYLASETACKSLLRAFEEANGNIEDRMRESVIIAHQDVCDLSGSAAGATTTIVFVVWETDCDRYNYLSIGDSRLYQVSNDGIVQISEDDTQAIPIKIGGKLHLSGGSVKTVGALNRAIGLDPLGKINIQKMPFNNGDMLALVSDGSHELQGFMNILDSIYNSHSLESATSNKLFNAQKEIGHDDATIALLRKSLCTPELISQVENSVMQSEKLNLPKHLIGKVLKLILDNLLETGQSELILKFLAYIKMHKIKLAKETIIHLLDNIKDDGTQETTKLYRELVKLC